MREDWNREKKSSNRKKVTIEIRTGEKRVVKEKRHLRGFEQRKRYNDRKKVTIGIRTGEKI